MIKSIMLFNRPLGMKGSKSGFNEVNPKGAEIYG